MMVTAKWFGLPVEVTGGNAEHGLAFVRRLDGKPFPSFTHGGWAETSESIVRSNALDDVQVIDDEDECTCTPETAIACPACRAAARARYQDQLPY